MRSLILRSDEVVAVSVHARIAGYIRSAPAAAWSQMDFYSPDRASLPHFPSIFLIRACSHHER